MRGACAPGLSAGSPPPFPRMRTGYADLPLHGGSVPPWLLARMKKLAALVVELIVDEWGTRGLLERLADPVYFQALNNLIGMDWDSSGSTTVTTAVLREVLSSRELGVRAAGGKGARSLRTPEELRAIAEAYGLDAGRLAETSYLVAKVDTAALQSGYQLYHHTFFVDSEGRWAVVQQGMKPSERLARRYHWFSETAGDLVSNPHSGVAGRREEYALNTVDRVAEGFRRLAVDLAAEGPEKLESLVRQALALAEGYRPLVSYTPYDPARARETVRRLRSLGGLRADREGLLAARELGVRSYRELLSVRGVGPSTIRALALVAELVYETPPSWRDPVSHPVDPFKFAYAVGGKDGVPFPVDRRTYDELLSILSQLTSRKDLPAGILRRLAQLTKNWTPPPEDKVPT